MFGGNEEVQQTLQRITGITLLNKPKQLTKDGGSRYFERREKGRKGALNGRVQGLWILKDKEKEGLVAGQHIAFTITHKMHVYM